MAAHSSYRASVPELRDRRRLVLITGLIGGVAVIGYSSKRPLKVA